MIQRWLYMLQFSDNRIVNWGNIYEKNTQVGYQVSLLVNFEKEAVLTGKPRCIFKVVKYWWSFLNSFFLPSSQ